MQAQGLMAMKRKMDLLDSKRYTFCLRREECSNCVLRSACYLCHLLRWVELDLRSFKEQSKGERIPGHLKLLHLTKPCMSANEWKCRTMCTYTILIVNLSPE